MFESPVRRVDVAVEGGDHDGVGPDLGSGFRVNPAQPDARHTIMGVELRTLVLTSFQRRKSRASEKQTVAPGP